MGALAVRSGALGSSHVISLLCHGRKTMHYSLLPQTTVSSASSTSASSMSTLLSRGRQSQCTH
eukprot:6464026-Amphidinium_carterae.1